MNTAIKNILITLIAAYVGAQLNGFLISNASVVIAPPPGANLTTEEGLLAAMPLMEPKHFLMPFLAHALGTLLGAIIVSMYAPNRKRFLAMLQGVLFLVGGIFMALLLPSPMWFNFLDLGLAYLPMAYLGYYLGGRGEGLKGLRV